MLKHYVVLAHQANVNKELSNLFAVKGLLAADQKLDWDLFRSFLGKKKIPSADKAACIAAVYGSFPTPAWLWAHGWKIEPRCELCGFLNDMGHIWQGRHVCEAGQTPRPKYTRAMKAKVTPPLACTIYSQTGRNDTDMRCDTNG